MHKKLTNKVIGHIIGLDEIHKKNLIKDLGDNLPHLKIIDLDKFQQLIYNHKETLKQKTMWTQVSKDITMMQKQNRLLGSKKVKSQNLTSKIKKAIQKRNQIKKNIHIFWKQTMNDKIIAETNDSILKEKILFIGFNIFPKDHRISIKLPLESGSTESPTKIMFDIKANMYAMNQVKYYLHTYSDRIVKGVFPLNLLKTSYLEEKYDKIINHYQKYNYQLVAPSQIRILMQTLDKQQDMQKQLDLKTQPLYLATMFRSSDLIPVGVGKPIQVYQTKEEALAAVKLKIKKNMPIYVYQISHTNVKIMDGKLFLEVGEKPLGEESVLLTI